MSRRTVISDEFYDLADLVARVKDVVVKRKLAKKISQLGISMNEYFSPDWFMSACGIGRPICKHNFWTKLRIKPGALGAVIKGVCAPGDIRRVGTKDGKVFTDVVVVSVLKTFDERRRGVMSLCEVKKC